MNPEDPLADPTQEPESQVPGQGTGQLAYDQNERTNLMDAGFSPCAHNGCGFMHAPGLSLTQTCPNCGTTPEMADQMGNAQMQLAVGPGGATRSGLSLKEQGDIGENLLKEIGYLPGYGKIVWTSPTYTSPLDMATEEWGIEVRSYNVDNAALQFNVGPDEKITKNAAAAEAGYKGILGVLVALDFRRSLADIYVKPFTLNEPWGSYRGQPRTGIGFYRPNGTYRLLEEVPFRNPYMLPNNDAMPETTEPHSEMPF
jgi:hypothetical protein